jgi:BrnA antitoxin of type II toxin-antitoxin system
MNAKAKPSHRTWVDPDDAPKLTVQWIEQAELRDGDKIVRRGRRVDSAKTPTAVRLDNEVSDAFRTT